MFELELEQQTGAAEKGKTVQFDVDNYFITPINGACNEGDHIAPEEKREMAVKVLKLSSLFFLYSLSLPKQASLLLCGQCHVKCETPPSSSTFPI